MSERVDIDQKAERVLEWAAGRPSAPWSMSIGPTYLCNLDCVFCPPKPPASDGVRELKAERLVRVVREAGELGVCKVNISGGGEPFLRTERTFAVMREIKARGMGGTIVTNGTLITDEVARGLVEIGWDMIILSIDGPDAETHDELRSRPGAFAKLMTAVERIRHWKETLDRPLPMFKVYNVLNRRNADKITDMINLARGIGAVDATFVPVIVRTPVGEKLKITEADIRALQPEIERALARAGEFDMPSNLGDFVDSRMVTDTGAMDEVMIESASEGEQVAPVDNPFFALPCYAPWLNLVIHPYGYIDPCEYDSERSLIGERSIEDLWLNDEHLNAVRAQLMRKELTDFCAGCCEPVVADNRLLRKELDRRVAEDPELREALASAG